MSDKVPNRKHHQKDPKEQLYLLMYTFFATQPDLFHVGGFPFAQAVAGCIFKCLQPYHHHLGP